MALFKRFFQAGRVVIGRYGSIFDKPAVVVDIIDLNRVIIEGPTTDVPRQVVTVKRLALTDQCIELKRGASSVEVTKALQTNDAITEWKKTAWGKKRAAFAAKRQLTDYQRFKLVKARTELSA